MLSFFLQKIASLLPRRYRGGMEVAPSSAVVSGILQFLLCLGLFIYRYLHFAGGNVFGGTKVALKATEIGGETALMGSGLFVLAAYMLQPLTMVMVYFTLEGMVRFLAAGVTGEIIPTLPLGALALLQDRLSGVRSERALGARVADQMEAVNSPDIKLRIRSCRQKPAWDQRITIFYQDELYEVAGNETGASPRRFVYLLRPKPPNKVVRGTCHYNPNEALSTRR